jgi:hypothetical protein
MYDVVKNPIPRSGFFATRTLAEIQAEIERLPATQKAMVYTYVMATLNACNQLVEDEILSKEVFAQ